MPTGNRVIRGGAFNNTSNNVRCAYRNRNNPNNRNNNIGFRMVVSTLFIGMPESRRALSAVEGFAAEAPKRRKNGGAYSRRLTPP